MSAAGTRSHGIGGWFPEELQTEILSRLPNSASIARFRCVSKSWRSLLSDNPEFIAKILFSSSDTENSEARVITASDSSFPATSYSIHSYSTRRLVSSGTLPEPGSDTGVLCIAGCAAGIFCISHIFSTRKIILWNPTTSEAKLLPSTPPLLYGFRPYVSDLGFGFDPATEDYKVLVWLRDFKSHRVFVYSLRKNSWRRLCRNGSEWLNYGCGRRVGISATASRSSRCHWISSDSGREYCRLASFDLRTEAFTELELPAPPRGEQERMMGSTTPRPRVSARDSYHMARDGSCLVAVYSGTRRPTVTSSSAGIFLEVWAALDYEALGRKECCWMRLYNVCADDVIPAPAPGGPSVRGVWVHGEFFVRWLVIDDPRIGGVLVQMENGMVDHVSDGSGYLELVTYRPSTISLSRFGESKKSLYERARDTCRSICRTVFVR